MSPRNTTIIAISFFAIFVLVLSNGKVFAEDVKNLKPVSHSSDRRYQDFGNGTILDTRTRLMWMKRDYWQMEKKWVNWYTANGFAQKMNNKKFAGYSDWRLPTSEEAEALYDARRRNVDKDGDKIFIDRIFPKGAGWGTWTSEDKGAKAIVVSLKGKGGKDYQDKISGTDAFLRLVRGPLS